MSDREIADRLGLSLRTAEDHVHNIIKKVGYSSRRDIRAGDYPGNG